MEIRNEKIFFNEMQRFGFRGDFSIFTYKSSHDWCLCLVHLFAFAAGVRTHHIHRMKKAISEEEIKKFTSMVKT